MQKNEQIEKYLFIIPTARVSDEVMLLLEFLNYLSKNAPYLRIETIVQNGSDNNPDTFNRVALEKYGPVLFMQECSDTEKHKLKERIKKEKIDVIFYNSILSIESQLFFKEKECKKVFYVHEMERLINRFELKKYADLYKRNGNLFIAGSENIRKDLIELIGIQKEKITVVHSFINTEYIKNGLKPTAFQLEKYDSQYKVDKPFTIGFSGNFELKKSVDLLLPLVVAIRKKIKNPNIFWVGASPYFSEAGTFDLVMHDVKTGGFENNINFIPDTKDNIKYFQRFDVYVTLSREESFPAAQLGLLGIPVICFDNSGASSDYAKLGAGAVVPYMDLGAIADKVYEFYNNPKLLSEYKKNAPGIIENNFSVTTQAPKLLNTIKKFIKEN